MAGQIPAHTVQIQDGRRVLAFGRPPPAVDIFPGLEAVWLEVELLHTAGQPTEPARCPRLDAKDQFPLFMLQHGAAHWQADDQCAHAQPGQPAAFQARKQE
jgi:hypothetical protein